MKKYMAKGLTLILSFAIVFTSFAFYNAEYSYAAAKPGKVSGLKVSKKNATTINMSWKKVANAKKYEVYFYDGVEWNKAFTIKGTKCTSTQGQAWKYTYKVRAVNGKKKGAFSTAKSIRLSVTNYPNKNVPNYGTMYNCKAAETGIEDGMKYYVYNEHQYHDDYINYLKDIGWEVISKDAKNTVLLKDDVKMSVGLNSDKIGKYIIVMMQ